MRILVGFPPGGGSDAIARLLAEKAQDELRMPVVVENRPGAGGQIAAQALKATRPTGTTLFLSHDHTISIPPQVVKNPGYDPVHDFVSVGGFATFVNAFAVSGGTRPVVHRLRGLGEGAGKGKGRWAFRPGVHARVPGQAGGRKVPDRPGLCPYRGSAPMMADMLGNQIAAGVGSVQDFIENHKAGQGACGGRTGHPPPGRHARCAHV